MKQLCLLSVVALLVALFAPGIVWAAPQSPTGFTISPNPAFPGETITFSLGIDGLSRPGGTGTYSLCFYSSVSSGQTYTFPAAITSAQGDSWTLQAGAGNCANLAALRARYTTSGTKGEFGDTLTFNVAVGGAAPASTVADAWQARQYDGAIEHPTRGGAAVQWIVASTVYVANDTATCGSNTPCLTGSAALNRAVDGVSDPGGTGTPGIVTVLGAYLFDGGTTADLTAAKEVTVNGVGASVINSGTCANSLLSNTNAGGVLTIDSLTLSGSCASGQRTAGVLNSAGSTSLRNVNLQNFTGSGNVGVRASGGTLVVEGSTFSGNQAAMDSNGGVLYAFANNVTTNIGLSAATNIDTADNVRCNYWSSYNVAGADSAAQFEERLGSTTSTYIEGAGALALGRAALAAGTGNRVIVNLGRSTSAPPFGNGTVTGLGSLTSDFFAVCLSRSGTVRGVLTIDADNVTPGPTGHRLYHITATAECSPSTNAACWDYTGQSSTNAGAPLSDSTANQGHYVIGNQVDPTAVTVSTLTAAAQAEVNGMWLVPLLVAMLFLVGWLLHRRSLPGR